MKKDMTKQTNKDMTPLRKTEINKQRETKQIPNYINTRENAIIYINK